MIPCDPIAGYYCTDILEDGYQFATDSSLYFAPADGNLDSYRAFVGNLPHALVFSNSAVSLLVAAFPL